MDKSKFSKHIELNKININDDFFNDIISVVENEVIPYQYLALNDKVEGAAKSYCIENFKKAGKIAKDINGGKDALIYPTDKWEYNDENSDINSFKGWVFQDSDLYKWIEGASYLYAKGKDKALFDKMSECVDLICNAQLESGYLDTLYIINDRDKIFTNLKDRHELYCFGHLTEAAIAFYDATGDDRLLKASIKFADLIYNTFYTNGVKGYPGHEIAEMALIKLYEATQNEKYASLAKFFIDERGKRPYYFDKERGYTRNDDTLDYYYNQAHEQPKNQTQAVGHAVRGVYLYSGMADTAKHFSDDELLSACESIWNDIQEKKMYITGGIGSTADGEAFTGAYDLPNDTAYCETCASIGLIFFARRMLEISPNSKYADVMERALYNTVLSGMSNDGKSFFYVNPLEVTPELVHNDPRKSHIKTTRQKWFGCACCPPNLARLTASLGEYCISENDKNIFVHLYIGNTAECDKASLNVKSSYIDNGKVTIHVKCKKKFCLALRIPQSREFSIDCDYTLKDGYAYIEIDNDKTISIQFDSKIRMIKCSNLVKSNIGKAAIMRGPVVYCIESVDNGENLQLISLAESPEFKYEKPYITANGYREKPDSVLYSEYKKEELIPCKIKFKPYSQWANSKENEMSVYIRIK